MSSSKNGDDPDAQIRILKRLPAPTPPGYEVVLTAPQAVLIAEFVDSPAFKVVDKVFVRQRMDHIARTLLNSGQTVEHLHYFKGMAAELKLFVKAMGEVKKTLDANEAKEDEE